MPTAANPRWAIVVAGGPGAVQADRASSAIAALPADAFVVAADSGLERATALGLRPDVVVGDFDSVAPDALAVAEGAGVRVERHPTAKDATDLELAIGVARASGATHIVVVAGDEGRFDHTLANALLLGSPACDGLEVTAVVGRALLTVVRSRAELHGEPGSYVSLLALGGPADGIVTEGLRYPLRDERLVPGTSRGVSNEFVVGRATVTVASGVLLAVQP